MNAKRPRPRPVFIRPVRSFLHPLSGWLVLVENPHLDVARRLVAQILLTVDGAARNIVAVAGLEHHWRLPLDRECDLALLDRGPLIAGVAVELIPGSGRRRDR